MPRILASKSRRAENGEEPIKEHLLLTRYNPGRVNKGVEARMPRIRSESRTEETSGLVVIMASSAK
jgi:septum formation inhibitor-activating ATPase MinD